MQGAHIRTPNLGELLYLKMTDPHQKSLKETEKVCFKICLASLAEKTADTPE